MKYLYMYVKLTSLLFSFQGVLNPVPTMDCVALGCVDPAPPTKCQAPTRGPNSAAALGTCAITTSQMSISLNPLPKTQLHQVSLPQCSDQIFKRKKNNIALFSSFHKSCHIIALYIQHCVISNIFYLVKIISGYLSHSSNLLFLVCISHHLSSINISS